MKKLFKKEFTLKEWKKYRTITTIVSSSIIIFFILLALTTQETNKFDILVGCFLGFMGPFCIYILFTLIFKIDRLEALENFKEDLKEAKEICYSFLSKEEFTQVTYSPEEENDEIEMFFTIFKNEGYTFWAKFDNDENIILIVKNKENNKVYEDEIDNYCYFNLNFKKTEI